MRSVADADWARAAAEELTAGVRLLGVLMAIEAPSEGEVKRMKAVAEVVAGLGEIVGGAEVLARRGKGGGEDE
jgi:hypothetical protein